ncbi:methyltransferase domain-containing protein [Bremerella sp. JC817]|uniref:methyltransferase domain-containing protein n=1 Tax=Bremerella sp. JC817 TaxID=3231756 RepID=UPI0034596CCA
MPYSTAVDCYDYPQYWDLSFRDETPTECDFFEAAFERFGDGPIRRVLDLGCGGGRNVIEMAARGFDMVGLDNNETSLKYLKKRLNRRSLEAEVMMADMINFEVEEPLDAALCTFNTFRHLISEKEALHHLRSVTSALRPGGLYILGFHIIPLDADPECHERWTAQHGKTKITTTLKVVRFSRQERREILRFNLHVRKGDEVLRLKTEYPYRLYTGEEFRSLLRKVPELQIREVYDFWYDIDDPVPFDHEISDAVFVLQKKA